MAPSGESQQKGTLNTKCSSDKANSPREKHGSERTSVRGNINKCGLHKTIIAMSCGF